MAAVVGFAFLLTAVTPVGKRVFLLVITTIPSAMRRMATTAGMVKKAAVGGKKNNCLCGSSKRAMTKRCYISTRNKLITFSTGASRTFFYRQRRFLYLLMRVYPENIEAHETHMTPTAKRNSYRVAIRVVSATQGSVLRPQPWAGESQLHYLSAPRR